MAQPPQNPAVLIVGAGVSGLLLAQHLRKQQIPFRIFERDADLATRGLGWGLTLHWSLPALRTLLPEDIVRRLPESYVDRVAVHDGPASGFPFSDLSTGKLVTATPAAPESQRIRVARDRFRALLATGVDVEWGRGARGYRHADDGGSVTVELDDGEECTGSLLVACDGGNSRIRRRLLVERGMDQSVERHKIPVFLMGVKVDCTPEQIEPLRALDPFFLQGAASENDTFVYFSILDAPGTSPTAKYSCQIVASWPSRDGFSFPGADAVPPTNQARLELIKRFAETWSEPFRSFVESAITDDVDVKALDLLDWAPPRGFRGSGRVVLAGDAFHPMAMYRGEGANHAILDIADLVELAVSPHLASPSPLLRAALDAYEDRVVDRARPGVLASRRACLDAHEWGRINDQSPLLTRRVIKVGFEEEE